jgi:Anaphase-promoting complex sub unit 1 C-terminal domain
LKDDVEETELPIFCMQILYECLCQDKMEMVPIYVSLFHDLNRIRSGYNPTSLDAIYIRIIIDFVKQCQLAGEECVLDPTFTDWFRHDVTDIWTSRLGQLLPICGKQYLITGCLPPSLTTSQYQVTMALLEFFQWPKPKDLGLLTKNSHSIQPGSLLKSTFHLRRFFPLIRLENLRQILQILVS